jgi:hypothetical protein
VSVGISTTWTCPECGERIPVHLDALVGTDGTARSSRIKIRVKLPDAALADAFTHAWSHREEATR